MASSDLHYFRVRAAEERQRAAYVTDPNIRAVHLDFAQRYEAASRCQNTAQHLQSSMDAITRSFTLLSETGKHSND